MGQCNGVIGGPEGVLGKVVIQSDDIRDETGVMSRSQPCEGLGLERIATTKTEAAMSVA